MANTDTTTEKSTSKKAVKKPNKGAMSAIIGIGLLMAVVSIAYSSTIIIMGTEGILPLVFIAPQVILAGIIAVRQFIK